MKKYLIYLGMLLCLPCISLAETTLSFKPSTVALGESAELVIETDRPLMQEPDLSALSGNFAVAGTQTGMHSVSVNGKRRTRYTLSLNVFPRKEGALSTGDLIINGTQIKAATLTVEPAGSNKNLPITFTASTNQATVYPDESFLLKIKLSHGIALLDAKIMPVTLENATITPLDMDKTYQEYQDGIPVHVFERTFSVTPDKSGYLTIPPIEVYGLVAENAGNTPFSTGNILFDGLLGGQKEVRLETNPVQVTVLERPVDWQGWWLPSGQVALTAEDTFPEQIKVGDSLTRVIKLTALGTEAQKLPVPKQTANNGFKIYPSPEQRETIQTPVGDIQGVVSISYVLVPTAGGEITLPEVRVPWFNTKTRQTEVAILPAKTITVLASEKQTIQPPENTIDTVKKSVKEPVKQNKKVKKATPKPEKEPSIPQPKKNFWGWIIASFGIALGLGLGLGFLLFRRKKHHSYRIINKASKNKKKKKPLPDLYPF